jgi:hypothetical protein
LSRGARIALVAAAVVAAALAFVLVRPEDDDEPASPARTAAEPGGGGTEREPRPERIAVRGGRPVGGVKRLEFEKGETVRLVVRSDAAEEVHVHGYDVLEPVRPGRTARLRFRADIEGVFEVELERAHVQIARLVVEP